jgi:hypothetical protein
MLLLRRHRPDVLGQLARDLLQHLDAGRVDAVVVGDEDAQRRLGSMAVFLAMRWQ